MKKNKYCLCCYQELTENEELYHPVCSKKFFGTSRAPQLPYKLNDISNLAKKFIRSHVTVTGVQTKLSLHLERYSRQGGRFTIVGLWGNYILKPPIKMYPEMPETEDLTMHLATFFGIPVVKHCLVPLQSGELAYITRRIDRTPDEQKIHLEDMCQLTGRLTEDKYKGSMEQVAKSIRKYSSNPLLDVIRFFEIALFSYLTGNADMHLKNFSLIYPLDDMIQLAPAYDLISTRLLIPEKMDPEEMALSLNGRKNRIQLKDFEQFAQTLGISSIQYQNSMERFRKNIQSALNFIDQSFLSEAKKNEFKNLIYNRANQVKLIEN